VSARPHARKHARTHADLRLGQAGGVAGAERRDGQAEPPLLIALQEELRQHAAGPAPRRGPGAARVGQVGGVEEVHAQPASGKER
jgi:hypothetical protein